MLLTCETQTTREPLRTTNLRQHLSAPGGGQMMDQCGSPPPPPRRVMDGRMNKKMTEWTERRMNDETNFTNTKDFVVLDQ